MENVLIVCKTPFQIITALVLKLTKYNNCICDMVLMPEFSDVGSIKARLEELSAFESIFVPQYESSWKKTYIEFNFRPKKAIIKIFGKQWVPLSEKTYSILLTNGNSSDFDNALYCALGYPEAIFYDEGYSSYTDQFLNANDRLSKIHKVVRNLSVFLTGRKLLFPNVKRMYLYNPDLIVKPMPFKIEKIWEQEQQDTLMEYIRQVFDASTIISEYKKPYIYFEECFANDFNNNGDLPIIEKICGCVGKDNLMVKLHPRDKTNRFGKYGLVTNKTLSAPAEVLASILKDTKTTFITFSSGSVLNYKFISDYRIKGILLYKLMPEGFIKMPEDRLAWFEKFLKIYGDSIYAPETFEELYSIIREIG